MSIIELAIRIGAMFIGCSAFVQPSVILLLIPFVCRLSHITVYYAKKTFNVSDDYIL